MSDKKRMFDPKRLDKDAAAPGRSSERVLDERRDGCVIEVDKTDVAKRLDEGALEEMNE